MYNSMPTLQCPTRAELQQWYIEQLYSDDIKKRGEDINKAAGAGAMMTYESIADKIGAHRDTKMAGFTFPAVWQEESELLSFCQAVFKVIDVLHVSLACIVSCLSPSS